MRAQTPALRQRSLRKRRKSAGCGNSVLPANNNRTFPPHPPSSCVSMQACGLIHCVIGVAVCLADCGDGWTRTTLGRFLSMCRERILHICIVWCHLSFIFQSKRHHLRSGILSIYERNLWNSSKRIVSRPAEYREATKNRLQRKWEHPKPNYIHPTQCT